MVDPFQYQEIHIKILKQSNYIYIKYFLCIKTNSSNSKTFSLLIYHI